jgi:hypothetical protein
MEQKHPDSEVIERLGDTSAVAAIFGIKPPSVSEWKKTGIPPARRMYLQVVYPDAFVSVMSHPAAEVDPRAQV